MNKIVKRDGAIVTFNASKIETAILKAAKVTKEFDEKEAAMLCMEKTIQASLRTVDVCTRFSSEQFLVVLMDAEKEDIDIITNRIFDNFSKVYQGKPLSLDYDIAEVSK